MKKSREERGISQEEYKQAEKKLESFEKKYNLIRLEISGIYLKKS